MVSARWGAGITLAEPTPAATAIWRRLPRTSRCKRNEPIMTGKRVLRKREVLERLGIRKTTLYESFIKTGRLRFVKIGARAVGVIEDELDVLIEELRRERDRSIKSPSGRS